MFSEEFALLSKTHQADAVVVRRLEGYLQRELQVHPRRIIDERIVAIAIRVIRKSSGLGMETDLVEKRKRPPAHATAFPAFPQVPLRPGAR
jgi:hypothetical protein